LRYRTPLARSVTPVITLVKGGKAGLYRRASKFGFRVGPKTLRATPTLAVADARPGTAPLPCWCEGKKIWPLTKSSQMCVSLCHRQLRQRKAFAVYPVPSIRANGGVKPAGRLRFSGTKTMSIKCFSPLLLALVGGLVLSLGGCMAAIPLAQMALSQTSSGNPACSGCTTTLAAGPMGDVSKGVTDSFRKWTGGAPTELTAK
jgi:hypothetical protein